MTTKATKEAQEAYESEEAKEAREFSSMRRLVWCRADCIADELRMRIDLFNQLSYEDDGPYRGLSMICNDIRRNCNELLKLFDAVYKLNTRSDVKNWRSYFSDDEWSNR